MIVSDIPIAEHAERWPHVNLEQFNQVKDRHGDLRADSLENMQSYAMDMLEKMVAYANDRYGWKHQINSSYRAEDEGKHGEGIAIDLVFFKDDPGDLPVMEQWAMALRFNWGGIGFYPYWNTPGLHVDMREVLVRAMWYYRADKSQGQITEYLA